MTAQGRSVRPANRLDRDRRPARLFGDGQILGFEHGLRRLVAQGAQLRPFPLPVMEASLKAADFVEIVNAANQE